MQGTNQDHVDEIRSADILYACQKVEINQRIIRKVRKRNPRTSKWDQIIAIKNIDFGGQTAREVNRVVVQECLGIKINRKRTEEYGSRFDSHREW